MSVPSPLQWMHSPRRHGLWTQDGMTRIAYIGLSHRSVKPTVYSWYVEYPTINTACGEALSLREAKKQIDDVLKEVKEHDRITQ